MRLKEFHKNCFACGEHSVNGLKLKFELLDDGILYSKFKINKNYQGYDNKSHGGIVSTILVSSMINLFYKSFPNDCQNPLNEPYRSDHKKARMNFYHCYPA